MLNRKTLMILGPSEAHPEVLSVLSKPIMAHYGIEWGGFMRKPAKSSRRFSTLSNP